MEDKKTIEETKVKWVKAFSDESFQKKLLEYRNIIETEINGFITNVKKENRNLMMFESLESRVKSIDSFTEKLSRNGYLYDWKISSNEKENQEYILLNLPDVIGYRISCYFVEDEKIIFDELLNYSFPHIVLDRDTNTKQNNGHDIFKLDGVYKDNDVICNFEIQIKALVNNVWGEVEHRTIYKRRGYDFNITNRKKITEGAYDILHATDGQLNSLFEMNYDISKLVKGLFYEQTKEAIKDCFMTEILGKAYNNFFELFFANYKNNIQVFVANKLLGNEIQKKEHVSERNDEEAEEFKSLLFEYFKKYDISMIKSISEQLFIYNQDLDFYKMILDLFDTNMESDFDDQDYGNGTEDAFYEEQEMEMSNLEMVIEIMKSRLDLKEVKRHA